MTVIMGTAGRAYLTRIRGVDWALYVWTHDRSRIAQHLRDMRNEIRA